MCCCVLHNRSGCSSCEACRWGRLHWWSTKQSIVRRHYLFLYLLKSSFGVTLYASPFSLICFYIEQFIKLSLFSSSYLIHRYLFVPNVLSAAVSRGCTMLHPGYGFLAENAGFVDICREHGINFIGPNVSISLLWESVFMNELKQTVSLWAFHYKKSFYNLNVRYQ